MAGGASSFLKLVHLLLALLLLMLTSDFPGFGLFLYSMGFPAAASGPASAVPEGTFTLEASIPDCAGVSTNWHYFATGTPDLEELFVSCVTSAEEFVIKRVDLSDYSVSEIVLATNVPTSSSIFAYLPISVCPTANGFVIGTLIPRADLGTTAFYGTVLNSSGVLQGTVGITLAGARSDRQAFFCRSTEDLAQFVYHGAGETIGETDTFSMLVSDGAVTNAPVGGEPLVVRRITDNRETDLADAMPTEIVDLDEGTVIEVRYEGLQPVVELDMDLDGDGSQSEIRYGGIVVPIMFDTMETADLRNWSGAVTN